MSSLRLSMRVWDAPVRLFHWAIVLLIGFSWLSQYESWMSLHFLSGYSIFALLLFRVGWGLVGSDTARFRNFLRAPGPAFAHLRQMFRREPDNQVGHNAAGGWMVVLLLVLLAAQVGTGLFSNDDISSQGPFADAVGKSLSDRFSHFHGLIFTLIEIAIVVHVLAVLAYAAFKRQDLVRPMVTGKKRLPANLRAPRMANPLLALALLVLAALVVWVVVTLG